MSRKTVMQNIVYPHPPRRVWAALTESKALAQWLLPNNFEPRVGHRFTFRGETQNRPDGWSNTVECEVVEVEPLHRLAYTWSAHPGLPEMLISFTLEAIKGGTRLRLEQKEFIRTDQGVAFMQEALLSLHLLLGGELPTMSRFFRIQVDEMALTDALFAFVTDPRASRNDRPVARELHTFAPEMVSVLENMVLDGVEERQDVADYVNFVFGRISA